MKLKVRRLQGFTLLEILTVFFIVSIIAVLGYAGMSSVARAMAVTTGADAIRDALADARANAITHNLPVEIRIYAQGSTYNALQAHWIAADGTTPPAARPIFLSPWVALDTTPLHSPLIASNSTTPTPDAGDHFLNAQTKVFRFLADGSTNLDPSARWYVTVRPANQTDPGQFPMNWACVAVDATTGRAQVYRP